MKIALIGVGNIGKLHLNIILNTPEMLVGICDVDETRLVEYKQYPIFSDYKKMIDETKPDVVHICTPHYLHKEMIIYALTKNINVFCEKPLCINFEEIYEIEQVLKCSNAQLGICFQNRYNPSVQFTKKYLEGKTVKSIYGCLMWHRDEKYYNQALWRGTKKYEGGGVLINQAIHTIDLMQYLSSMPKEIIANIANVSLRDVIDVEDNALISSIDNSFRLFASNCASKDFPIRIVIKTEDEKIEIINNIVKINETIYNCEELNLLPEVKKTYGGGHALIINDFYDCIKNKKRFEVDFKEAVKSIKIVLSSYESNGNKTLIE